LATRTDAVSRVAGGTSRADNSGTGIICGADSLVERLTGGTDAVPGVTAGSASADHPGTGIVILADVVVVEGLARRALAVSERAEGSTGTGRVADAVVFAEAVDQSLARRTVDCPAVVVDTGLDV
jgi:hypothetical protein